jgi:hypothetical protein
MRHAILIFSLVIISFQLSISQSLVSKRITASEDTYVFANGGADNAVIRQFDNPAQLKTYTHQSTDTWTYRTFLKFDLSTVCNNSDVIQTCTLKIVGKENQGSFQHKISVYALSSDSWTEDELSYSNLDIADDAVKLATVTKTIGTADKWFDFDITAKIKEYKAEGRNVISLMLMDDTNVRNPDNNQGSIVTFYSKDAAGTNYPRLAIDESDISALKLDNIEINGEPLDDFSPDRFNYQTGINPAWSAVPTITATPVDAQASVTIAQAAALTGTVENRTATISISKNGISIDYKVTFGSSTVSNDALLSNIKVDGQSIEFFNKNTFNYKYYYPYTQTAAPVVAYTGTGAGQQVDYAAPVNIFSANENERTATLTVTSPDEQSTAEYKILFEILPELDLYLCIGQSNMAGRGYMNEAAGDFIPLENALLFTPALQFAKATNPMNQYSNIRKELSVQEVSPSWGFAKYINDNFPNIKTGMIVNARGGTAIEEWLKGQNLYNQTVARAQHALRFGTLRGILWHQGESNSAATKVAAYPQQLASMVADLRADLNAPDAIFIAGELIYTYSGAPTFNPMIRTIQNFLENSDWVSAQGLTARAAGDVHFNREGNITLGERYAEKVIEKYYNQTAVEQLTVDNSQLTMNDIVEVYDISGRKIANSQLLNLRSQLKSGIYIVKSGNYRAKFIIK